MNFKCCVCGGEFKMSEVYPNSRSNPKVGLSEKVRLGREGRGYCLSCWMSMKCSVNSRKRYDERVERIIKKVGV